MDKCSKESPNKQKKNIYTRGSKRSLLLLFNGLRESLNWSLSKCVCPCIYTVLGKMWPLYYVLQLRLLCFCLGPFKCLGFKLPHSLIDPCSYLKQTDTMPRTDDGRMDSIHSICFPLSGFLLLLSLLSECMREHVHDVCTYVSRVLSSVCPSSLECVTRPLGGCSRDEIDR